jgi:hypothetical protein
MAAQLELPAIVANDDRVWCISHKYDRAGAALADAHYSRRTIGAPQFMPPGQTLVLITPDRSAVFGWWRPHPRSGITAMNGLDGWTCSIFRNTGPMLSSDLVLAAELELQRAEQRGDLAAPCGPDGLLTYIWARKIRSTNPGFCFLIAGWTKLGVNARREPARRKLLLHKPMSLAGIAACAWGGR